MSSCSLSNVQMCLYDFCSLVKSMVVLKFPQFKHSSNGIVLILMLVSPLVFILVIAFTSNHVYNCSIKCNSERLYWHGNHISLNLNGFLGHMGAAEAIAELIPCMQECLKAHSNKQIADS